MGAGWGVETEELGGAEVPEPFGDYVCGGVARSTGKNTNVGISDEELAHCLDDSDCLASSGSVRKSGG